MEIKFKFSKKYFFFYTVLFGSFLALMALNSNRLSLLDEGLGSVFSENRVIKCQLPLDEELVQNVFYVAPDLQTAKKQLFNAKNGLFFDNELFIKTIDFKGNTHVIPFSKISCDSVGTQVII